MIQAGARKVKRPEREETTKLAWSLVEEGHGDWQGGKPQGLKKGPQVQGRRAEEIVLEDRR